MFIGSKPPLIVFILCLLCFFTTLVILMIYLNTHEVKNPDIIDWNTFKESLSSLDYCVKLTNEQETHNNLNLLTTKADVAAAEKYCC
jgi:Transmembrane 219